MVDICSDKAYYAIGSQSISIRKHANAQEDSRGLPSKEHCDREGKITRTRTRTGTLVLIIKHTQKLLAFYRGKNKHVLFRLTETTLGSVESPAQLLTNGLCCMVFILCREFDLKMGLGQQLAEHPIIMRSRAIRFQRDWDRTRITQVTLCSC